MTPACPDCVAGFVHCHAVVVVHAEGTEECLADPVCDVGAEAHPLVGSCEETLVRCACDRL